MANTNRQQRQSAERLILGSLTVVAVVGTYAFVTSLPTNNPAVLPPLSAIWNALVETVGNGNLISALFASLKRIAIGFCLGAGAAVVIGSLMGWFRRFEYLTDPIIEALRPIPPLAYIPLIIIWLGVGEESRILVITLACFLTCIINVIVGMKQVPKVYVDAAATLGASRVHIFRTVALPAALPYIFTGLRIALAAAWTTLVASELVAAQDGLGFMLQEGRRYFRTDQVMLVIAVIGVCAFTMDRTFRAIQGRLTRWAEIAQ